MDQVNVQGCSAPGCARSAARSRFAGFLKIIPVFILVLPGVAAAALSLDISGNDGLPDYNRTYSVLVQTLFPTGLKGVVLAALLAALMSSISSMFNSASTLVARDLVARFNPGISQRTQILIGQFALVLVMVGGILTTPLIGNTATFGNTFRRFPPIFLSPLPLSGSVVFFSAG